MNAVNYPHLSWCFSSLGCPELSLSEIMNLAQQFEIPLVELRAISDRMDLPEVFSEEFGTPESLREWLRQHNLRIAALDSSAKLVDCPRAAQDELIEFAEWANAAGIPAIRVFDGGKYEERLSDDQRKAARAFIRWWQNEKNRHQWTVDIIVETHDMLCSARNCLELAEYCDPPLNLLWDAHHTWRKGGEDPIETWKRIQPLVRHIHFKDSVDKPSARHPFTYTHLGEGEFSLSTLLDRLHQDGFQGPVSLEWERRWHPYLPPLNEALSRLDSIRNRIPA